MQLYGAFDLHSKNNYLAIIDERDKRVLKKKLPHDPELILGVLSPFRGDLTGIVVESTFNWYWLVDLLMEEGFRVHLANPSRIKQYEGLKQRDDNHDAFWLAHLLRLGILSEGYIYPREERPVRDLLRKRGFLVKIRTALILNLQGMISNHFGFKLASNSIKKIREDCVVPLFSEQEQLAMNAEISKESIDFLTRKIKKIEGAVEKRVKVKESFQDLQTIPGIGKILSFTISLETGCVDRFPKVGNYVSYCRKVPTRWSSNGKSKGRGNKKNGNRYLSWAYSEAAELGRRYDSLCRAYYQRKMAKTNFMVAHNALAHKLARAAYFIMRDQVPFDHEKLFS